MYKSYGFNADLLTSEYKSGKAGVHWDITCFVVMCKDLW